MISFLQPWALLALGAAAIPALLHLRGRRMPPVVVFPAVRYLTATEREHSRRLKLRNWLLLVLRTLAIVFLVLAAARPISRFGLGGSHAPTAITVLVDNSMSSAVVVEGEPQLSSLVRSARGVLSEITPDDQLWVMFADEVPRRTTRQAARRMLDNLAPLPVRLDLSDATRVAARTVLDDPRPQKLIVLVSDLQASALSAGQELGVPIVALRPAAPPQNRWLDTASVQPPVWSPGGTVVATVGGTGSGSTTVRLVAGGRDLARAVARPGDQVGLSGALASSGWTTATVELDPDELRYDDIRHVALFAAPPARARASAGAGQFVADALAVLRDGGRVATGDDVEVDDHFDGEGTTVVLPPADAALVGAVNRSLASAGVSLRFGERVEGQWALESVVGGGAAILRRHRLDGEGVVFGSVAGEPWLAREGNVVLIASRLEPDWSDLPVSAQFIPFLDYLVNRVAARAVWRGAATPGEPVTLPPGAVDLVGAYGTVAAPADLNLRAPLDPGVYYVRDAAGDTVGALAVNVDPRESRLEPAGQAGVRAALGTSVRLVGSNQVDTLLFAGQGRADLTGALLLVALLMVAGEFAVASSGRAVGGRDHAA